MLLDFVFCRRGFYRVIKVMFENNGDAGGMMVLGILRYAQNYMHRVFEFCLKEEVRSTAVRPYRGSILRDLISIQTEDWVGRLP